MKPHYLFAAIIGSVCLAGCQNITTPLTDAQADAAAQRVNSYPQHDLDTAYLSRPYLEELCQRALIQLGIFPSVDNQKRCGDQWALRLRQKNQQQQAEIQLQQQAKEQAQQAAFNQRIAEIRAGRASIQTIQEAVAIYHASNGDSLMAQPLLHPNGHYYLIGGEIDPAGGLQSNSFIIRETATGIADMKAMALRQMLGLEANGAPAYAYISFQDKNHIPNGVRVGSTVSIVGAYTGNREYTTRDGTKHIMPVFTSRFVQTITAVDVLKSLQ